MGIRISAIQQTNTIGNKVLSFAAAERLIAKAASDGAALAALPELSSCGYIPNDTIWEYGEAADGDTARWACEMAKRYSLYLGAGFLETDGRDFFNTYLLASPAGKIVGCVRKMKPETYCFKPSDAGSVIDTELGKIAVGICADNHGIWFYDRLAELDFDLLLMPHAWPTPFATNQYVQQKDIDESAGNLRKLGAIYSVGFGVPVVFSNAVGEVPPMRGLLGRFMSSDCYRLRGGSAVFKPDGTSVCAKTESEEIVSAEIELGRMREMSLIPKDYNGWLHPGSGMARKILIPLDSALGTRYYKKHHLDNRKSSRED